MHTQLPAGATAESMLAECVYLLEATHFEQYCLWCQHGSDSQERTQPPLKWEQGSGWGITVGHFADHPVVISLTFEKINGHWVGFWYPTSQVVDHRIIDKWFEDNYKRRFNGGRAAGDAANFHNCLFALQDLQEPQQ